MLGLLPETAEEAFKMFLEEDEEPEEHDPESAPTTQLPVQANLRELSELVGPQGFI